MIYMIADTHFGDDAIRRYEKRPFSGVEEMDDALVSNWNREVTEEDTVYVLGDFCAPGREKEFLNRLRGKKILIKGNHDVLDNASYREAGFEEVYDLPVILENFWILSHEPLYVNENMPYANLFGHVHGSPMYLTLSGQHYCLSAERVDYTPISFEKVKKSVLKIANGTKNRTNELRKAQNEQPENKK